MPFVTDEELEERPENHLPPVLSRMAETYGGAKKPRPKSSNMAAASSPRQQVARMNRQLPPGMQVVLPEGATMPPAPPQSGAPRNGSRRALSARTLPPQPAMPAAASAAAAAEVAGPAAAAQQQAASMMLQQQMLLEQLSLMKAERDQALRQACLLYTSPSPRDATLSRMPSSA